MKKLMFVLLLMLPVFIINAQEVEPKEELASIQVIDHLYDKTTEAISTLAKALEVPADHVYSVLVKQQIINGCSSLITILFFIFLSLFVIKLGCNLWDNANKNWNKVHNKEEPYYKHYDFDDGNWTFIIICGIIAFIISIIVFFCSMGSIFTGIFNPEYGAIKDIMSIL